MVIDERVLIDGGGVNPVPHDLLQDCDITIAIDVMGSTTGHAADTPNLFRAVLGTFDIMQNSIIAEKRQRVPPTIYIKPDVTGVDILEFYKADEIYAQAAPAADELRRQLRECLAQP